MQACATENTLPFFLFLFLGERGVDAYRIKSNLDGFELLRLFKYFCINIRLEVAKAVKELQVISNWVSYCKSFW